jgi:hypothetical protein
MKCVSLDVLLKDSLSPELSTTGYVLSLSIHSNMLTLQECYCGSTLNLALKVADSKCTAVCFGNPGICGGGFLDTIYSTGNGTAVTYGQAPANLPARRAIVRGGVRLRV